MLGGEFISFAEKKNLNMLHPFKLIENHLSGIDILFINLEGPIYKGNSIRTDVKTVLSNNPAILEKIGDRGICIFNLANNHIMDYGLEGLAYTIKLLKKNRINYVGAGLDYAEANKELIIDYNGITIAFLAFTSNESHVGAVLADEKNPGCASYRELDDVLNKIYTLKNNADIVCVSLHWGHEYHLYPSYEQVSIARSLVDAGANYVIGHHPHVVQGIEMYKDSLIVYSLGNFFLPPVRTTTGRLQLSKPLSKEFMIVTTEADHYGCISYDVVGGERCKDYVLVPYNGEALKKFESKIQGLSERLKLVHYDEFWVEYRIKREKELVKESLGDAYRKLLLMSWKELIKTLTISDLKRNIIRLFKVITGFLGSEAARKSYP